MSDKGVVCQTKYNNICMTNEITTREFLRNFPKYKGKEVFVTDRQTIIGKWIPACFLSDKKDPPVMKMANGAGDGLTNTEKEEAGIPVMARCKNCGLEWDIKKVPCYETWSEEFGEDVIICDNCVKFKAGGNRKMYLNMLKTMKRI